MLSLRNSVADGHCSQLVPAGPDGLRSWRLIVTIPSAEAGDDPGHPGEAFGGMRIALQLGATLVLSAEPGEDLDLHGCEGEAGRLGGLAVAGLDELECYDGGLCGDCGELEQSIGAFQAAVFRVEGLLS